MLDFTPGMVVSGLVLSAIGIVLFRRGKRDTQPATLISGLLLMVLPLFAHSLALLWAMSGAVMGGLLAYRRWLAPSDAI